jgi:hypothetical protein
MNVFVLRHSDHDIDGADRVYGELDPGLLFYDLHEAQHAAELATESDFEGREDDEPEPNWKRERPGLWEWDIEGYCTYRIYLITVEGRQP